MKAAFASLSVIALASCASPQQQSAAAPSGRDCFNSSFVSGFSSAGRGAVRLDAGPGRTYQVELQGPGCDQISWTEGIALQSSPSPWICVGDGPSQGNIYFRDPATRQPVSCFIGTVQRIAEPPRAR